MKTFALTLFLTLILTACKMDTSSSVGLSIEDSELARITNNEIFSATDKTFSRGEDVHYILYNVGEFTRGDDGLCWLEMDLEVTDEDGEVVFTQDSLLGENGKVALEGGYAGSPYATFTTSEQMDPGTYRIKVKIYDRLGKGRSSVSTTFDLQ